MTQSNDKVTTPPGLLPFSWEEAQKRPDAVLTRDGRSVMLAGYNPGADAGNQLVGWLGKRMCGWHPDGQYYSESYGGGDLFLKPEVRKIYVNVYPDGLGEEMDSIEECKGSSSMSAIGIVMIETCGQDLIDSQIVHRFNQEVSHEN